MTDEERLSMWHVDDGTDHWVIARDPQDALAVWREEMARLGISDEDLDLDEAPSACVVPREAAARLRYFEDDPSKPVGTMLSEFERDCSRRYVGGSEF